MTTKRMANRVPVRPPAAPLKKLRCAVYTRVSDDEGLDQEYNTLDAQRDAAHAYIRSQQHEGWVAIQDEYRDEARSGGNLARPGLKRLIEDIRAGKIDVVVVYKIDRITRSLRDFFELMDVFNPHGVSFVSVTQQFNTSTAMGVLMVNILLAFAQFEREQTIERIRDKIAATKRKGMYTGGVAPLGYDVVDRKYIVNEVEAALVRRIFESFAEHGSAAQLVRQLQIEGQRTKAWVTKGGIQRHGRPIDQQCLHAMLRNRLYVGEVTHKGEHFPGVHQPIIQRELWDRVQAIVEKRKQGPRERKTSTPALLAGLLYAPDGQLMVPTYTQKANGKRYRYYVPYLWKRRASGATDQPELKGIGPLPAADIEAAVLQQIHAVLGQPEAVIAAWRACRLLPGTEHIDEAKAVVALRKVGNVWDQLFPAEQQRIARILIQRIDLHQQGLDIVWRDQGWTSLGEDVLKHPFVQEQQMMEAA